MIKLPRTVLVAMVVLFGSRLPAATVTELKISAIPDEHPQEMLRIYTPFADYLTKEIGIPVKFTLVGNYAEAVQELAADKLDMVWYGGLTSVQAVGMAKGAKRIVMRREDTAFKASLSPVKIRAFMNSRV